MGHQKTNHVLSPGCTNPTKIITGSIRENRGYINSTPRIEPIGQQRQTGREYRKYDHPSGKGKNSLLNLNSARTR